MHTKRLYFDGEGHCGAPTVQYVDRRDVGLAKHASCYSPETLESLRCHEPVPGHTLVLVLAMSAYEHYGFNRNGDGFTEGALERTLVDGSRRVLVRLHEALPQWHHTFETTARNYMHHRNTDPNKSVGYVVRSIYNWRMHRVELIIAVRNDQAARVVERIQCGEFPAVSMGCHIDYDVCIYCGNQAPTRATYCRHVSGHDLAFGLGTILPSGLEMGVLNPCPRLFDISWVIKPADRIAYMMSKVAMSDAGVYVVQAGPLVLPATTGAKTAEAPQAEFDHVEFFRPLGAGNRTAKIASAMDKLAEMDKWIAGDLVLPAGVGPGSDPFEWAAHVCMHSPPVEPLSGGVLDVAAREPVRDFLATASDLGVAPTHDEIFGVFSRLAGIPVLPEIRGVLQSLRRVLLDEFASEPAFGTVCTDAVAGPLEGGQWSPKIAAALAPHLEKRSMAEDLLLRRYVPESAGTWLEPMGADVDAAYYGSAQQPLHVRDPRTGGQYLTQRITAEQTDLDNLQRRSLEAGLLATGTLAGYGALHVAGKGSPWARALKTPVALAGGALAGTAFMRDAPTVRTHEGVDIPANTPMAKLSMAVALTQALRSGARTRDAAFEKCASSAIRAARPDLVGLTPVEWLGKVASILLDSYRRSRRGVPSPWDLRSGARPHSIKAAPQIPRQEKN